MEIEREGSLLFQQLGFLRARFPSDTVLLGLTATFWKDKYKDMCLIFWICRPVSTLFDDQMRHLPVWKFNNEWSMKEINDIIISGDRLCRINFLLFRILGGRDEIFIINDHMTRQEAGKVSLLVKGARRLELPASLTMRCGVHWKVWRHFPLLSSASFRHVMVRMTWVQIVLVLYWYRAPTSSTWAQIGVHELHRDV